MPFPRSKCLQPLAGNGLAYVTWHRLDLAPGGEGLGPMAVEFPTM